MQLANKNKYAFHTKQADYLKMNCQFFFSITNFNMFHLEYQLENLVLKPIDCNKTQPPLNQSF